MCSNLFLWAKEMTTRDCTIRFSKTIQAFLLQDQVVPQVSIFMLICIDCKYCNPQDTSICIQCLSSYSFMQGECLLTAAIDLTIPYYPVTDDISNLVYLVPCHYSCTVGCTSSTSSCTCDAT